MGKGGSKLPETGDIPAGIDAALFQQLPSEIQAKVTEQYKDYKSQYDELQSSYDRLRVDSEQRYFELERNSVASNERLETETRSASQLRATVDSLEQKVKDSAAQIEDLQRKKDEAESLMRELESSRCSVEVDKNDLTQALESKNHEIDRLTEEWKEMSTKLAKANKERVEALAQKDQVDTQIVSIQYREQRLQQENGLLQRQNEWFDQELKTKVNELLNLRKDQSSRMLEMEATLEQRSEENVHMEEMVKGLKETIDEQAKKIENYCEKLRESREMQTQQEEQHRGQVHSQSKLIALYQTSASDAEVQVKELTSAVSELQKLLKDASEAYTGLEKEKQEIIDQHVDTISDKDAHIDRMEKELQHANELLEVARKKGTVSLSDDAIEALSPSAAAASRLLKSGMTLTQIYSEYVKSSEELLIERQENERLQQYLDKILEEIEEKAPLMKKQREDYEKSITVIDQLTRQLDAARCEEEKLRVDSDDSRRKVMHFTRENQRMKQQTLDLGQQVRMLLKELEEARGTVVSHDISMDADVSVAEVSSSSQVISEKLVTFRGIEELQKKNQELIAALRNLSDEREELEKTAMDARTAELKRKVETMSEELVMLQAGRDRQATMVESLVRQRDMYRVLLSESGSMPLPATPNPQTSTPRPAKPESPVKPAPTSPNRNSELLAEKTAALKELMEEFNQYREEKNKNEKMLTDQMEGFRKDISDQRVQNARLASQLDFAGERTKVLQNNTEAYKKEIAALRDKNQKYSASVIRHEQTINSLKEDLFGVKERLSRAEVIADNLRVERNMLKSIESRLIQEKEAAQREQSSQKLLLTNLQAIQNNLERSDFENKTRLVQRIEMLEKENAGLKSKLDGIDSQHRSIIATLERQLAEVQNESARRLQAAQSAKELKDVAEKRIMELEQQVADQITEIQTVKTQAAKATPAVQTESTQQSRNILEDEVKHFKNQAEADKAEINSLKSQLEQSRQHSDQYKTMANSLEQTLKEETETNQQFKESAEAQLKEARQGYERMEKQLTEVEKERQNLINMNFSLTENYHKTNAGLQKQLQILQSELEEAVTLRETAIANEQAARSDHSNQATLAQEAQEKYERELILHAADVEALTNVKQELEGFNNRLSKSEEEAKDAKISLDAAKSGWVEQEKLFKDEETKLKARIIDLQEQNRMLHEEMEAMSEQVMSIQHRREQEQNETAALASQVTSDTTTERSTDQLVEVIRFLRKEKEIAEARLEVTQAESTRVKQRAEYLERQLEESNRSLTEERQSAQVNLATAAQQMELMRKVDNLNLVTESNKLLRGERDQLSTQLREAETKNKKLEEEITPLQICQREIKAECEALATEKTALTAEVERWRARTNHLIEQCNKTDPEEHKLLLTEREILKKQVNSMTEEAQKQRADISRLNANIVRLEGELKTHKEHVEESRKAQLRLNTQLAEKTKEFNTQLAEKTKESDDKNGTITQLRKVGRKYKLQVEQLTSDLNKLKAEQEAGVAATVAALEEKIKKLESEMAAVSEKLGSADFEKNEAQKALKESEVQCKAIQEALDKASEELKRLSESDGKLEAANKAHQEEIAKHAEDLKKLKESETKQQQLRNILSNSKTKLVAQKAEIEKLTKENSESAPKMASLQQALGEANAKKGAYESRIGALERELNTVKTESQQLQQKVTMLQKQLESQPKSQQAATPKPTVSASPVPSRHTGPKANITPMATVSVQPFPVQPVRRTVAPTPPTATVMPTSISAPEGEMASPSSQVRPTPPVQTVSPHIESDTQASTEPEEIEAVETPQDPTPSTSTGRETGSVGAPSGSAGPSSAPHGAAKRTREGTDGSDNDQEGPVKRPKTQVTQVQERTEPEVAASVQEVTALEPEVETEEQAESPAPREVGVVEPATQQPASTQPPAPTQQAPLSQQPTSTQQTAQTQQPSQSQQQEPAPSSLAEQKAVVVPAPAAASVPMTQQDKSAAEAVIVLDDDDDEEEEPVEEGELKVGGEFNEEDEYEEEEDDDGDGEYDEEEDEEGDEDEEGEPLDEDEEEEEGYEVQGEFQNEEDEEGEEMEEDYNSDAEMSEDDADDNQEIVIVDDDDDESNETPMESQEEEQPQIIDQQMGTQDATQVAPRLRVPRTQPRAEPSPSTSRAQQLQPFLLATQVSQFEEGDDSIVPSTPTLVIPKGTDQVAISSPQVPQGRFQFGSGLAQESSIMSQSDLSQLASQGGVDDTRMDLSQFDDAAGRSMPTTPRSRTPPTISITEAPRDDDPDGAAADGAAENTQQQSTTPMQEGRATPVEIGDGENVAESTDVDLTDEPKSAAQAEAPAPSTSQEGHMDEGQGEPGQAEESESQDDKPGPSSTDQSESPAAAAKPKKIQRIVWDQPSTRRPSRGPRGPRGMGSTRGQAIQRLGGASPYGQQQQQPQGMFRGNMQQGRAGRARPQRSRRSRPFT